jgi:hypothetical protein
LKRLGSLAYKVVSKNHIWREVKKTCDDGGVHFTHTGEDNADFGVRRERAERRDRVEEAGVVLGYSGEVEEL